MKQVKIIKQAGTFKALENDVNNFIEGKNIIYIVPLQTESDEWISILITYEAPVRNFNILRAKGRNV